MLMEEKTENENPNLNAVLVFPDAGHVAKHKRQSFSKLVSVGARCQSKFGTARLQGTARLESL